MYLPCASRTSPDITVADFVVVIGVVVFGVEGFGDLVVCLYELVHWVGRVVLGIGDLAVDVVGAALGVRVFLVVCSWVIGGEPLLVPSVLDTGLSGRAGFSTGMTVGIALDTYPGQTCLIMGAGFQIPAFFTLTPTLSRQGRGGSGAGPGELVAGYVSDELAGGLEPVAGPEAPDYAVHDVHEEADDGLAVVGALAHDARNPRVVCEGWRGEGRGEVFEGLVRRAVPLVRSVSGDGFPSSRERRLAARRLPRRLGWHWMPVQPG